MAHRDTTKCAPVYVMKDVAWESSALDNKHNILIQV